MMKATEAARAGKLYEQISDCLTEAVPRSVGATLKTRPKLTGFALCTDSGLSTLFSVATDVPRTDWRWPTPNEWTVEPRLRSPVDRASKLLAKAADRVHIDVHTKLSWTILETTLELARAHSPKLLLLVLDTDPDPWSKKAMFQSAKRLNSSGLYKDWRKALITSDEAQLEYIRSLGIKI